MIYDKSKFIEKLNIEDLVQLYINMLPRMSFATVKRTSENILEVSFTVANAGTYKNCYIFFNESLNKGKSNELSLAEIVNKKLSLGFSKVNIVTNKVVSNGFKLELNKGTISQDSTVYIDNIDILRNIEESYEDYWRHSDQALIAYEGEFEKKIDDSFQIRKLVEYKAAYQKLLSIFIEPNLFLKTEDKQSTEKAFTRIQLNRAVEENERLLVLHGDPGTGKTRLLNEIGRILIEKNKRISGKRSLPIFVDTINLRDSFSNIDKKSLCTTVIESKLSEHFIGRNLNEIIESYQVVILIDSIDEFEQGYKEKIVPELEALMDRGVLIFLATRSNSMSDTFKISSKKNLKEIYIQKFNNQQVERFANRYFEGKTNKAEGMLASIRENKVIDKLPLTPLNISLISILYEETGQQEIPATLNDIYDKFSNLLLGRTMADKSIDFLDITIKENILGTYALELLKRKNSELFTKEEFFTFFEGKLSSISGTIDTSLLPKALDFIVEHTGLLVIQKEKYVKFRHDSYMEYFAAKEIFKNHRGMEDELVQNFFDVNWQFTAVFYAGSSRRMPDFLFKVIEKIKKSNTLQEYWASANGVGYLLQALYLTDDEIRKTAILEVLSLMVDTYEGFKKIYSSIPENVFLGRLPLPVISVFPIFLFQDNFDSITLRKPLSSALDNLLDLYDEKKALKDYPYLDSIIYQILILAITVSSDRLGMEDKLSEIIGRIKTTTNDFYTKVLEVAIDNLGNKGLRERKNEILNPKLIKNSGNNSNFIRQNINVYAQPGNRHRFGKYDKVTPNKRVKLFVEGPSDALILEHAYFVLTEHFPYWEIKVGDIDNGGANGLAKSLNEGLAYLEADQIVIGIFDNDSKGLQEFNGALTSAKFDYLDQSVRIKKRKEGNIYGMLLPVPEQLQYYIQARQTDNYFSIEHYFPHEFLEINNMLKPTAIDNIYGISESKTSKVSFAKIVGKSSDSKIFTNFILLFREIDKLTGMTNEVEYLD